jgi:hypothetical protein
MAEKMAVSVGNGINAAEAGDLAVAVMTVLVKVSEKYHVFYLFCQVYPITVYVASHVAQ